MNDSIIQNLILSLADCIVHRPNGNEVMWLEEAVTALGWANLDGEVQESLTAVRDYFGWTAADNLIAYGGSLDK